MIAIIDYGMGNLRSVQKAFEQSGYPAIVTRDIKLIAQADKLVLPGVGAFHNCMDNLRKFGMIEEILAALDKGKPFLGICLGLQLLFTESEEFGLHQGLNIIKGRVVRFPHNELKIPHMGWNTIAFQKECPLLKGIEDNSYFYFVHSFYVVPEDKDNVLTTTEYGVNFVSSIYNNNIFACQFHPEKSQSNGLKILENFGRI